MENMQLICDHLAAALKETRAFRNLAWIQYEDLGVNGERIILSYGTEHREINVSLDSGFAMISDIIRALG